MLPTLIEVIPAAYEQQPVVARLLELYAYDFTEFRDLELGVDGCYGYPKLRLYWRTPGRHPFLVKIESKLAGLVFVKRGSELSGNEAVWDMAEFFVMRKYRRRGVGMHIAHDIWKRFPGSWEVRVIASNGPALRFWERAITAFTSETIHSVPLQKGAET